MEKFKIKQEVSDRINAKILLKPEEVEEIRYARRIVASAVHPDTN